MPIYPDRKNGELTGRYRVEVTTAGERRRGRANSLPEAKALEARLRSHSAADASTATASPVAPVAQSRPSLLTMSEGRSRARGLLWSGQATERDSFRKLDRIIEIVGPNLPLDDFDANSLDQMITALRQGGCSDATLNRYLSNVSKFLKWCYRRKLRATPVPEVDWRDEDEGRIRWITYEEEAQLLAILPEPHRTVVYAAIRTGMRAMELLSLTEEQVSPRWVYLWGVGTKSGKTRSVPINDDIFQLLAPLVSAGAMPEYWSLRYEWDIARKAMGLDEDRSFVFHACRHTYATRAVQAGVNIRVLQRLMGHSAMNTTLRYAHVDDCTLTEAVTSSIDFHDKRSQGHVLREASLGGVLGGAEGGAFPPTPGPRSALRGASSNRRPDGGVVTQRTANPVNDD